MASERVNTIAASGHIGLRNETVTAIRSASGAVSANGAFVIRCHPNPEQFFAVWQSISVGVSTQEVRSQFAQLQATHRPRRRNLCFSHDGTIKFREVGEKRLDADDSMWLM